MTIDTEYGELKGQQDILELRNPVLTAYSFKKNMMTAYIENDITKCTSWAYKFHSIIFVVFFIYLKFIIMIRNMNCNK